MSSLVRGRPGSARIRPLARDQPAVPGQQRARRDQPVGTQHSRQQPGQRRQDRPVGPVRLGPGDLTAQHSDLMTEHHDLRILGRLAAAQQHQPAKDPDHDQVEQAKGHKPRSCRNQPIRPNRSSQHLRRVLKRYRSPDARAGTGSLICRKPAVFRGRGWAGWRVSSSASSAATGAVRVARGPGSGTRRPVRCSCPWRRVSCAAPRPAVRFRRRAGVARAGSAGLRTATARAGLPGVPGLVRAVRDPQRGRAGDPGQP